MVCNENLGVQTWAAMNIWGPWHRLQWFTHKSSCINSILGIFSFSQPLKGLFSLSRSLLRHSLLTYLYSIKDMWVHFYRLSMMFKGSLIYGLIKGSCESSFLCGWNLEHCLYIYIYPKYLIFYILFHLFILSGVILKKILMKTFLSIDIFVLLMFNISNLVFSYNLNLFIKIVHFCSPKVHGYIFFVLHIKETNYLQHWMVDIYICYYHK